MARRTSGRPSTSLDLNEVVLDTNHPLARGLVICAVGGRELVSGARLQVQTNAVRREYSFPWGYALTPYHESGAAGEIFVSRNVPTINTNIQYEHSVISAHANVGGDANGALFSIPVNNTTFDYTTHGMYFAVFGTTQLEAYSQYYNGTAWTYGARRTVSGIFEQGTPTSPLVNTYAYIKRNQSGLYNGAATNWPFEFYKNGDRVDTYSFNPTQTGTAQVRPWLTSGDPSFLTAVANNSASANRRTYGYHGFTFVYNRALSDAEVYLLSNTPQLILKPKPRIFMSLSGLVGDQVVTSTTFAASAVLSGDSIFDDAIAASLEAELLGSVLVTDTQVRDYVATPGIIDVEPVAFTAAANEPVQDPPLDVTGDGAPWTVTGALAVVDPAQQPTGVDQDAAGAPWTATAALGLTTDAAVVGSSTDVVVEAVLFTASARIWAIPTLRRDDLIRQFVTTPTDEIRAAALASVVQVWRAIDILNFDETLYRPLVGFIEGTVSVDMTRDERRTLDLTLDNFDRSLSPTPNGFWYDKIIRVRRGISFEGVQYEFDLGYFMIDRLEPSTRHRSVKVTGRDYTKKMLKSKFATATSFPAASKPEDVVKTLALVAGVQRIAVVATGQTIGLTDVTFDGGISRWEAAHQICQAATHDLFFDRDGTLRMLPQADPVTNPTVETFGDSSGNTISMAPSTNDDELYNDVVVTQENAASGAIPIWSQLENNQAGSPTRISRIGRRTKTMSSKLITTQQQADDMAKAFLAIAALEQFEVNLETLNYPWLDVGKVVKVQDSDASRTDPDRYLLSSLSIPLKVGPMSGDAKRITVVG
jgi:hypothetical protein